MPHVSVQFDPAAQYFQNHFLKMISKIQILMFVLFSLDSLITGLKVRLNFGTKLLLNIRIFELIDF